MDSTIRTAAFAALAAAAALAGGCFQRRAEETLTAPPPESPALSAHRPVHGAVVTVEGDPLPSARLEVGGRLAGVSNAYGEFCVYVPVTYSGEIAFSRPGYEPAALAVAAGGGPLEAVVRMRIVVPDRERSVRAAVVCDVHAGGVPDAEVEALDPSGAKLWAAKTLADGSVWCAADAPRPRGSKLRVRHADWPVPVDVDSDLAGSTVRPPTGTRDRVVLRFALEGRDLLFARRRFSILDVTGRESRSESFEGLGGKGPCEPQRVAWLALWSGAQIVVRRAVWDEAKPVVIEVGEPRRIDLAFGEGVTDESFDVRPAIGAPRIVPRADHVIWGRFGSFDSWTEFRPARSSATTRTLWLDAEEPALVVRSRDTARDVRILSSVLGLAGAGPAAAGVLHPVETVRGAGRVEVTVKAANDAVRSEHVQVRIFRRGGPFRAAKIVRAGETAAFEGLCAGVFDVWLEPEGTPPPDAPGVGTLMNPARVVVDPGGTARAAIRWSGLAEYPQPVVPLQPPRPR